MGDEFLPQKQWVFYEFPMGDFCKGSAAGELHIRQKSKGWSWIFYDGNHIEEDQQIGIRGLHERK